MRGKYICTKYILNSHITSQKSIILDSSKSKIMGGKIIFFENLICSSLGNANHIPTEIYVGYSYHNERILETHITETKKLENELKTLFDELKNFQMKIKKKQNLSETEKKLYIINLRYLQSKKKLSRKRIS